MAVPGADLREEGAGGEGASGSQDWPREGAQIGQCGHRHSKMTRRIHKLHGFSIDNYVAALLDAERDGGMGSVRAAE